MIWQNKITEMIWTVNAHKKADAHVSLFVWDDVYIDVSLVLFFMHLVRIRACPLISVELIDLSHVIR